MPLNLAIRAQRTAPRSPILLYNIPMQGLLDWLTDNKDLIGVLVAILGFGGLIPLISALLRRARMKRQPTEVKALEVVKDPPALLAALYSSQDDDRPLAHHNIRYQPRQPGRDIQTELKQQLNEKGCLLIAAPTGHGKTREAVLLAQTLALEGYRILWVRKGWLDLAKELPPEMGLTTRWVVLLDNMNLLFRDTSPDPRGEKEPWLSAPPYRERLEKFLDQLGAQYPGGLRVIATARNEASEWTALGFDPEDSLWRRFMVFELPPPHPDAVAALLELEAGAARVDVQSADLPDIARGNHGGFKNAVVNLQRLEGLGLDLSHETYSPTADGTWRQSYALAVSSRPGAAVIYDAIDILRQAGVELYPELVAQTAALVANGNFLRQWLHLRAAQSDLRALVDEKVFPQAGELLAPHDGQIEGKPDRGDWRPYAPSLVRLVLKFSGIRPDAATDSLWEIGERLYETRMFELSFAVYRRLTEIRPDSSLAWSNLGVLLDEQKRPEEAERAYRTALEHDPAFAASWTGLGLLLDEQKRPEEAERAYRTALEHDPAYAIAWTNLGILLAEQKRPEEAERAYRTALEHDPADASAWNNLGNLMRRQERYEDAEEAYRNALHVDPNDGTGLNSLGFLYRWQGKLSESIPWFEKSCQAEPLWVVPLLNLAGVYKSLGDDERAAAHIATTRAIIADDDWYNLACLENLAGNIEEAFDHLRHAVEQPAFDSSWAWQDPDLEALRGTPRFEAIVGPRTTEG